MFLRYLTVVCLLATAIAESTTLVPSADPPNDSTISASTTTTTTPFSSTTTSAQITESGHTTGTTTVIPLTDPSTSGTTSASTHANTTPAPRTTAAATASVHPTKTTSSTSTTKTTTTPAPPTTSKVTATVRPAKTTSSTSASTTKTTTTLVSSTTAPVTAQVFPGRLRILSEFVPEMADRSSEIFRETASNISDALFKALYGTQGYVRSDVVKLEAGSVVATVNNIYQDTDITDQDIQREIEKAAQSDEFLRGATFNITDLCDVEPFPCEETSTTCSSTNGVASCSCIEGYVPNSTYTCIACPSGYKAVEDKCKPCAFGYSGFNCNNSSQLVVVVVFCVLGGILLIALFAFCFWKGPLKNLSGRPDYAESSISSENGSEPTLFHRFPHATTQWDDEFTEGGHTYVMMNDVQGTNGWSGSQINKPETMMAFKGKNPSHHTNLIQGHKNPHYLSGDGGEN